MSKKTFMKINESLISSRIPTRRTTPTISKLSTPTSKSEKGKTTATQSHLEGVKAKGKTPGKKIREMLKPRSLTSTKTRGKMNLSPIVITISPDESTTEEGKSEVKLAKIMDNFFAATAGVPNSSEFQENERKSLEESSSSVEELSDAMQNTRLEEQAPCVDFGIADYLCNFKADEDEVEIDMSSDTDSNFIDATPPNRFSDSDFEGMESYSPTSFNFNPSKVLIHKIEGPPTTDRKLIARRPFRRHISLPPSIFMSRFFGETNENKPLINAEMKLLFKSSELLKRPLLASGGTFQYPRINRLESISSSDFESADTTSCFWANKSSSWSMSIESNGSETEDRIEQESAFTSDIEKRALILRNMRRLIRQDTTVGNFAPPHFRNT